MTVRAVGIWRSNTPASNPRHWARRGWYGPGHTGGAARPSFDLPRCLFFTAASGRDAPVAPDDGMPLGGPADRRWQSRLTWRDGWVAADCDSVDRLSGGLDSSTDGVVSPYYRPVRPMPSLWNREVNEAWFDVLRAPFPLTSDVSLTLHATCSLGHVDDPPFMLPYTGRPSVCMVELMNGMAMKPGWIVWNGYLYVWVNRMYWCRMPGADPDLEYLASGMAASMELVLFRAYCTYYEQLRRELPCPYAGPIVWPDQCDPRFPLPSDPRYGAYV
ncbi:hypothetical protein [Bifidobacterium saguinibicoloris]|uniref:hypothetical protein n=1 Tax=Bifidobacterium saguinibicoloris TaxID=2834433 RepID=UPI001C56DAFC|nr:hypothetical protein [Bifidobacterium saguinibicoloris]MBW3081107.1 hypothetical protein [Bifidobacterium saguinibicoloris]